MNKCKAATINLDDKGQPFAGIATIRAAAESVIDRGWKCSINCDVQHPWHFATEMFLGDIRPDDEALKHRQSFIDALIREIVKLQSPPHEGIKLENLCDKHKREVLPRPTVQECVQCEKERV